MSVYDLTFKKLSFQGLEFTISAQTPSPSTPSPAAADAASTTTSSTTSAPEARAAPLNLEKIQKQLEEMIKRGDDDELDKWIQVCGTVGVCVFVRA